MFETVQRIEDDPPPEPKYVHPDKDHAATEIGDHFGNSVRSCSLFLCGLFQFKNRLNILLS